MGSMTDELRRRKPLDRLMAEAEGDGSGAPLRRTLGLWQLTLLGISSVVGTGIFFVLGTTVPKAGPGVVVSFAIAAVGRRPTPGSAGG
ncbi:hypothetical protein ACWCP6_18810 [Streptomyces sp. NPDC002004]